MAESDRIDRYVGDHDGHGERDPRLRANREKQCAERVEHRERRPKDIERERLVWKRELASTRRSGSCSNEMAFSQAFQGSEFGLSPIEDGGNTAMRSNARTEQEARCDDSRHRLENVDAIVDEAGDPELGANGRFVGPGTAESEMSWIEPGDLEEAMVRKPCSSSSFDARAALRDEPYVPVESERKACERFESAIDGGGA